jgi:excisionase family DNA binding protein
MVAATVQDPEEVLLRPEEVAAQLGVRPQTVLRWIREKHLPAIRLGPARTGQYRIRASTLREWLEERAT